MPVSANINAAIASPTRPSSRAADDDGAFEKRRWTSFLTWAFVLADMVGRDVFLPTAAHAGDDQIGHNDHTESGTAPIANNLPDVNISTATESPEPVAYAHAATMAAYASSATASELAAAKVIPVAHLGPDLDAVGHGGGGGGGSASADGSAGGTEASLHLGVDQPLLAAFGHDGSLVDLGLHLDLSDTTQSILGLASGTLGGLPLVGGLLAELGDTVAGTAGNAVSSLEPVVSLLGGHSAGMSNYGNDTGLPGQLLFSSADHSSAPSEILSPIGNYTTYGIALSMGGPHDSSGESAVHADAFDAHSLDVLAADHLPGTDTHFGSDALHLDQAILRTAADVLG